MLKIQSNNKCGLPNHWWLQFFILLGDTWSGGFFLMSKHQQCTSRFPRATQMWIGTRRQGGESEGWQKQILWIEELYHLLWVRCHQVTSTPAHRWKLDLQIWLWYEGGLIIQICTFQSSRWSWHSEYVGRSQKSLRPFSFFSPSLSSVPP